MPTTSCTSAIILSSSTALIHRTWRPGFVLLWPLLWGCGCWRAAALAFFLPMMSLGCLSTSTWSTFIVGNNRCSREFLKHAGLEQVDAVGGSETLRMM